MRFVTLIPLTFWIVLAALALAYYAFGLNGLLVSVALLVLVAG